MSDMDKAYKLLALQENVSNRVAKDLIDRGVVFARGKKIVIARADIKSDTVFKIEKLKKPKIIFEDEKVVVIDKPAYMTSEEIAEVYKLTLLHRLDKETTGVLLLSKNEDFTKEVIDAFRAHKVSKTYLAIVQGKFVEPCTIDTPLLITKTKSGAYAKVAKEGKQAITLVEPKFVEGKRSMVEIKIETGRTHQIRAHLKSIGFPVVGDEKYGGKPNAKMLLHAYKISLLGYNFQSSMPDDFSKFGRQA